MRKIKIPPYVTEEINKCLISGEKKPKFFWEKYRKVGKKTMEAIAQFGVIENYPHQIPELSSLERIKNILLWRGYDTAQKIREGIVRGEIFAGAFLGYGAKSHRDVCSALKL